ncbi:MAG: hypothetical protein IJ968_01900, partial [Clostridia bacterium]|nr:hypothetical protein [Clostridia bacterium]
MQNQQAKTPKLSLIWRFLQGSKRYFAGTMLLDIMTSIADMITPQIIRTTVDNVIGREVCTDPTISRLAQQLGGFDFLRQNLWMLALAVLAVAVFKVISHYGFMITST